MKVKVKKIYKLVIKSPKEIAGFSYWTDMELLRSAVANDPRIEDYEVVQFAGEGADYGAKATA